MGYLLVAIVAVAVAIFAMQNTDVVNVKFGIWEINHVPLAAVVLASLAAGIVIVGIPLWFLLWRARSRVRTLSATVPPPPLPPPTAPPDRPTPPPADRPLEG